jgi:hypothetical protein
MDKLVIPTVKLLLLFVHQSVVNYQHKILSKYTLKVKEAAAFFICAFLQYINVTLNLLQTRQTVFSKTPNQTTHKVLRVHAGGLSMVAAAVTAAVTTAVTTTVTATVSTAVATAIAAAKSTAVSTSVATAVSAAIAGIGRPLAKMIVIVELHVLQGHAIVGGDSF